MEIKCEQCGEVLHSMDEIRKHMKEKHGKDYSTEKVVKESFRTKS